jgi:succinate-semialdehyde dehydrogenase / glutarate-semialdehyde dehydrogenase
MISSYLIPQPSGYIEGRWISDSKDKFNVFNPATGESLAEISNMDGSDVLVAIEAASRELLNFPAKEKRQQWLSSIANGMRSHKNELARIITLEQGKPLKESVVEVEYAAGFFDFFSTQLDELVPYGLSKKIRGSKWTIRFRPAGVVGLITPWNFPLAMISKKLSAALASGCTVVAKPADLTPLSAIALWQIAQEAGLPPGRLNLILGKAGPIGEVFCKHPLMRVISFTGSTVIGQKLLECAAFHVKRFSLELGGNAPFIVFEDGDLDAAVSALVANKFRCAGQTCVCANRIYVQENVQSTFLERLSKKLKVLKSGNGMDPASDIGPLINRKAFDKVASHVKDALARGASRLVGYDPEPPRNSWGFYYPPTLLSGVSQEMAVFREETFGPVIAVKSFCSDKEVIDLANETNYGLAAYLFTRNEERAHDCIEKLLFGHVGINTATGPIPEAPFGGMKHSGFGREGGLEGLLEFCEVQTSVNSI